MSVLLAMLALLEAPFTTIGQGTNLFIMLTNKPTPYTMGSTWTEGGPHEMSWSCYDSTFTNVISSVEITGPSLEAGPTNVTWQVGDTSVNLQIRTNVLTTWTLVRDIRPPDVGTFAVMTYGRREEVGTRITNRVLLVIQESVINVHVLRELGRDAWPTRKRTVIYPEMGGGAEPVEEPL